MTITQLKTEMIALDTLSLAIGFAIGALVFLLFFLFRQMRVKAEIARLNALLESERAGLGDHFKILAQETLQNNAESFLNVAQEKLKSTQKDSAHDLEKKTQAIAAMVEPVQKHLQQLNGAVEQLSGTDKAIREDIQNLSKETARLTGALKNPAAQGKWGEFLLERLLDKANLMKGVHYDTQVTIKNDNVTHRPDAIIYLQDGFNIVVDAKAPITEFINALDTSMSEIEHKTFSKDLAQVVRKHVKDLGAKSYWENLDSPDFVVLFLPSENIFSTALSGDPDLVDFAADNNIVIASPTLLMSLLRVVGLSWRQVAMAQNAQEISKIGSELFDRINVFAGHLAKVGNGINGALNSYNKAVGTLDSRIMASARKLKDLNATTKDIETPKILEGAPRPIATIEDEENKKDSEAA